MESEQFFFFNIGISVVWGFIGTLIAEEFIVHGEIKE